MNERKIKSFSFSPARQNVSLSSRSTVHIRYRPVCSYTLPTKPYLRQSPRGYPTTMQGTCSALAFMLTFFIIARQERHSHAAISTLWDVKGLPGTGNATTSPRMAKSALGGA